MFAGELSIVKINNEAGKEVAKSLLSLSIIEFCSFFSVGKGMGETQVNQTAELIIDEFKVLTIADIKLCFHRAKAGYYGKLYDRLDGGVIMECLNFYFHERAHYAEVEQAKKARELRQKEGSLSDLSPEEQEMAAKRLKMVIDGLPVQNVKNMLYEPNEIQKEAQRFFNHCSRQFDNLFDKNKKFEGVWRGGIKFIKINGKYYNITEYVNYKYSNRFGRE